MPKLIIYALIALAGYLYQAYKKNAAKNEEEVRKANSPQATNANPTPSYNPQRPQRDLFKEMFGDQAPVKPRTTPQPQQKKKPIPKPQRIPQPVTEATIIQRKEDREKEFNIHDESLQQANNAYALSTDLESYTFNPREAVIASIILNRPEY